MSEAEQPPDLEPSSGAGEAKERQFPCGQCGASLTFVPGVSQMECTYCGHSTEIEVVGLQGNRVVVAPVEPPDTMASAAGEPPASTEKPPPPE